MNPSKISPKTIKQYQNQLIQSGVSESTVKRKLSSLRKFSHWLEKESPLKKGPLAKTKKSWFVKPGTTPDRRGQFFRWAQLSVGVVIIVLLTLFLSNRFFPYVVQRLPTPGEITTPVVATFSPWIINFRGKLTTDEGEVVNRPATVIFRLYDQAENGQFLWESKAWELEPNPEGEFQAPLGDTTRGDYEIPFRLFFQNERLYLGIVVDGQPETSPRIPVSTAAHVADSYRLGEFPPSQRPEGDMVPVLTPEGNLILAAASPKIESISGTFAIEGQAISILTPSGSDGNITLAPDGSGVLNLSFNTPTGQVINAIDANLGVSGEKENNTLFYGYVGNDNPNYYLVKLESGSTPTPRFSVDALGNTSIGGDLAVAGDKLTVDISNSRVGINTASPTYTLDVAGSARVTDVIYNLYGKPIKRGNETTITSDGWYRIAQTSDRASGLFNLMDMTTDHHQSIYFYASAAYPDSNNKRQLSVNLLSNVRHDQNTFSKIRLVRRTASDPVYLEVYIGNANNNSVRYILSQNDWDSGWTPVDWETGEIPTGYVAIEYPVTNINFAINENFLVVTDNGNVGLGTAGPGYKLDVNGDIRLSENLYLTDDNWIGIGASDERIVFDTGGDISFMGANVGIGTTTPAEELDIAGDATISGTLALAPQVQAYAGTCNASTEGKMYYDAASNAYYYCDGSSWSEVGGGAGLWEDGTFGVYEDDKAVIVGGDTAFSWADGGVGDLKVEDALEVQGIASISALLTPYHHVITVAKQGGDYTTISAALSSITDNSSTNTYLIRVMPGTYEEAITMKEYVDIIGSGWEVTEITQEDATVVTIADNSRLEGVTIDAPNPSSGFCIITTGAGNTITNMTINKIKLTSGTSANTYGICTYQSSNITVSNSEIYAKYMSFITSHSSIINAHSNLLASSNINLAAYSTSTINSYNNRFSSDTIADLYIQSGSTVNSYGDHFDPTNFSSSTIDGTLNIKDYALAPLASASQAVLPMWVTAPTSLSSSGTYLGVNAASGYTGDFINLLLNDSSKFKVDYQGQVTSGTILPLSGDTYDLGSTTAYWDSLYVNNIYGGGSGTHGFWSKTLGVLYPNNTYESVAIGGTSTISAQLYFEGTTGDASMSGNLTLAGGGAIAATDMNNLTLGDSSTQNIILNPNGNVGIGTTDPGAKLHVHSPTAKSEIYIAIDATPTTTIYPALWFMSDYDGTVDKANITFDYNDDNLLRISNSASVAVSQLVVSGGGQVGINTDSISSWLNVSGNITIGSNYVGTAAPGNGMIIEGNVGIGTTAPVAPLHVSGSYGSNAALIVDQLNSGDIFTASASGTTVARINNSGDILTTGTLQAGSATSEVAYNRLGTGTANFSDIGDASDLLISDALEVQGIASISALLTPYHHVVTVAKQGGDFTTITAALSSITDNSATNTYLIRVMPGEYEEAITMKQYVDIIGSGWEVTKITQADATVVTGTSNSRMEGIEINSTNTGYFGNIVVGGAYYNHCYFNNVNGNGNRNLQGSNTVVTDSRFSAGQIADYSTTTDIRNSEFTGDMAIAGNNLNVYQSKFSGQMSISNNYTFDSYLNSYEGNITIGTGSTFNSYKDSITGTITNNGTFNKKDYALAPLASASQAVLPMWVTAPTTLSTSGTYLGVNAASGYTGDYINLLLNDSSKFKVDYQGQVTSGTILPLSGDTYDLGSTTAYWDSLYVNNIYGGGSGTHGFWSKTLGVLYPNNTYESVAIGGTSTTSASLYFEGTTGNASISGQLTLHASGKNYINALSGQALSLRTSIGGDAGLTDRLYLTNAGYVGIGTTVPTRLLHVYSASDNALARFQSGDTRSVITIEDNDTASWVGSEDGMFYIERGSSGTLATSHFVIGGSGYVGIGTTSPIASLHIDKDSGGNAGFIVDQDGSGDILSASQSGTPVVRVNNSGDILTAGTLQAGSATSEVDYNRLGTTTANYSGITGSSDLLISSDLEVQGIASISALLTPYHHVVTVAKQGGDFTTITAALSSITDNSSTNTYLIRVMPGTYEEAITMKQYVDIIGSGWNATKITYNGDETTVYCANNSKLENLTVEQTSNSSANPFGGYKPSAITCGAKSGVINNVYARRTGFSTNGGQAILIGNSGSENTIVTNSKIYSNGTKTYTGALIITNTNGPRVSDCYVEQAGSASYQNALVVALGATTTVNNSTLIGGYLGVWVNGTGSTLNLYHSEISGSNTDILVDADNTLNSYFNSYDSITNNGTFNKKDYWVAPLASASQAVLPMWVTAPTSLSSSGTYLGVNAASGYTGDFINLLLNDSSKFKVDYQGQVTSGTILPLSGDTYDLGSTTAYWDSLYVNNIYGGGSGTHGFWSKTLGVLYPNNTYESVAIGGTSTASAQLYFEGTTGNASMSGQLTLFNSGTNYINALSGQDLSFRTSVGGDIGLTNRLYITNAGNVGIGTTAPRAELDVAGDASTSGSLVFRSTTPSIDTLGGKDLVFKFSQGGDAGLLTKLTLDPDGNLTFSGSANTITNANQLTLSTTGASSDLVFSAGRDITFDDDNLSSPVPFSIADSALNASLTQGIIDAINDAYDAATGGGGTAGFWSKTNGVLFPNNAYESVAIGGTSTTSAQLYFEGTTGNASMSGNLTLAGGGTIAATNMNNLTLGDSSTQNIIINPNGNVGIGTTEPSYPLDIYVNNSSTTPMLSLEQDGTGDASLLFALTGSSVWSMGLDNSDTDKFKISLSSSDIGSSTLFTLDRAGLLGIGTASPVAPLHVSKGYGSNATLIVDQLNSGDILTASASGSPKFVINNSGYVGIGTTSPSEDLDVAGNATFSGTLALGPQTEGYAGTCDASFEGKIYYDAAYDQVLYCDGSKWQADRTTATLIVAANDSQNKYKADYICDGTNDEVQIEAATSALPSGGGVIYLLEGTYSIGTSIDITKSNVSLIGAGKNTVLYLADEAKTDIIVLGDGSNPYEGIQISHLKFDGNRDNQSSTSTPYNGIYFNMKITRSRIINNWMDNNKGQAIRMYADSDGNANTDNLISGNTFVNNGGASDVGSDRYSVYLNYSHQNTISNNIWGTSVAYYTELVLLNSDYNTITGNVIEGNYSNATGAGIHIGGTHNVVSNNIIRNNGNRGINLPYEADYNIIDSNIIAENEGNGIRLSRNDFVTVSNNTLYNNSDGTSNTNDEIYIDRGCQYNLIINNNINTTDARYGIYEGIPVEISDYNTIKDNIIRGANTAPIKVIGDNTTVSGNQTDASGESQNEIISTATSQKIMKISHDEGVLTTNALEFDLAQNQLDSAFFYDGASYTDNTTEANSVGGTPYTLLEDSADYFYFGKSSTFTRLTFDLATVGSGLTTTWEYSQGSGSWTTLTKGDTTSNLSQDGLVYWDIPSDWATDSVNGATRYWVRVSTSAVTTAPTAYYSTISLFTGQFLSLKEAGTELFAIDGDGNLIMTDDTWIGISNSDERIVFDTAGDINIMGALLGIGTTNPAEELDIAGDATISGTFALGPQTEAYAGTCNAAAAGKMYYDGPANKYYYCNGSSWIQMGAGWEDGTYGVYEDDEAVIVGSDAAFSWADGGVGDLKIDDQLEVGGDASISGTLTIGQGETIRPAYGPLQLAYKSGPDAWTTGMVMTEQGYVGLGTATPAGPLDILSTASNEKLRLSYSSTNYATFSVSGAGALTILTNATGLNEDIELRTPSFDNAIFIDESVQGVGIGTDTPTAKLDIAGDASTSGSLVFRGTSPATIDVLNGDDLRFQTSVGGDDSLTPRMTITNAGDVGIGTTEPNEQFEITGSLRLPTTTASTGIIKAGADRFIHNYGTNNTFLGINAGNFTLSGANDNVGIGYQALDALNSGDNNTALGSGALSALTDGVYNTAVGYQALTNLSISTSNSNTAVGYQALYTPSSQSSGNTGMGYQALFSLAALSYNNTGIGSQALYDLTSGDYNTALGNNAGDGITTGNYNTVIGYSPSPLGITSGSYNTILGAQVTGLSSDLSNTVILADGQGNIRTWIDNSGNVGMGTTAPTAELDVSGTASVSALTIRGTSPGFINQINGNDLQFRTSTGGDTGLAEVMTITNAGNVGIGTTAPGEKLDISGNATISGNLALYGNSPTIATTNLRTLTLGDVSTGNVDIYKDLQINGNDVLDSTSTTRLSLGTTVTVSGNLTVTQNLRVDTDTLFVEASTDRVGIGTTTPTAELDVAGTASVSALTIRGTSPGYINQLNGNDLRFRTSTGGDTGLTDRMILTNAGNVGIGTTTPSGDVDIHGNLIIDPSGLVGVSIIPLFVQGTTTGSDFAIGVNNSAAANLFYIQNDGKAAFGESSPDAVLEIVEEGTTPFMISDGASGDGNFLIVTTAGNVGMGTTSPTARLELGDEDWLMFNAPSTTAGINFFETGTKSSTAVQYGASIYYDQVSDTFRIVTRENSTEKLGIALARASGNVGIGTTSPTAELDVTGTASVSALTIRGTSPGYINQLDGNDLIFRASAGGDTGLSEVMTITNSGNVGIGTTGPSEKLEVAGNIELSGIIKGSDIGARAYHDAAQAISDNILTALSFNSERWDTDTIHDTVTNNSRLTAKTAGYYQIEANLRWEANNSGRREIGITLNGSTKIALENDWAVSGVQAMEMNVSTTYSLSVNDYVELEVYQNSGGDLNVNSSAAISPEFTMTRIAGADLAEYYPTKDLTLEEGDIVSIDPAFSGHIRKANQPHQKTVGIISTNPAMVLGNTPDKENNRLVGLTGKVPVKVSSLNGTILIGDSITASSLPGIGAKPNQAGYVVAQALEEFNPEKLSCQSASSLEEINWPDEWWPSKSICFELPDGVYIGVILAFIDRTYYDPDIHLTDTGNVYLEKEGEEFVLKDAEGNLIKRIGAFAEAAIAKLRAGLVETTEIKTNLISPLADSSDISIQLGGDEESGFGKLLIKSEEGETVASIDSAGNASFGGLLASEELIVSEGATIAGELHVSKIYADEIVGRKATFGDLLAATVSAGTIDRSELDEIEQRLSELEGKVPVSPTPEPTATPTLEPTPTPTEAPEASGSGELDSLDSTDSGELDGWEDWSISDPSDDILLTSDITITGNLTGYGITSLADTTIAGQLMVDANIIIDKDGIQTLPGSTLKLQAYGWGGIDMLGGKVVIDTDGNVLITGTLTAGRINTGGLILNESLANEEVATSSGFGKLLAVINQEGKEVASIDASGSAFFARLGIEADYSATDSSALIAAADNFAENGYLAPAIKTNATAGIGLLPAGEAEVQIYDPQITEKSLIYVTATTDTQNKILYIKAKKASVEENAGWFIVALDSPIENEIRFNWWIIN